MLVIPVSAPAGHRPTATSKRSTVRSSTSAGARPSRATSFPASAAYAASYLAYHNHDRVHHGRLTRGRIPADIIYGARKMETR